MGDEDVHPGLVGRDADEEQQVGHDGVNVDREQGEQMCARGSGLVASQARFSADHAVNATSNCVRQ